MVFDTNRHPGFFWTLVGGEIVVSSPYELWELARSPILSLAAKERIASLGGGVAKIKAEGSNIQQNKAWKNTSNNKAWKNIDTNINTIRHGETNKAWRHIHISIQPLNQHRNSKAEERQGRPEPGCWHRRLWKEHSATWGFLLCHCSRHDTS